VIMLSLVSVTLAFYVAPQPLSVCSAATRVHSPAMSLTRGELLSRTAALTAAACAAPVFATPFAAPPKAAETIWELSRKAKALRTFAVTAYKVGMPVEARLGRFERKKATVLVPLLQTMTAMAPTLGLPEEQQKRAELLPLLLKGHYLELDEAVKANQFDPYVSKTTGKTYEGGKVEREIEEIQETAEEFIELLAAAGIKEKFKL